MNARGGFADGVEALNRPEVTVDHLESGIDHGAAAGEVTRHARVARPEGSLFDLVERRRGAAHFVLLFVAALVVGLDRGDERFDGHAHLLGQPLKRIVGPGVARRERVPVVALRADSVVGEAFAVLHRKGRLISDVENGVANLVASCVFRDKALAGLVDHDHPGRNRVEVRAEGSARRTAGIALDEVESGRHGAQVLHHREDFARRRGGDVRRREFFKTRIVDAAHFPVCAAAAGRRDHAPFGAKVVELSVLVGVFDAENASLQELFPNDSGYAGVRADVDPAQFLRALFENLDVFDPLAFGRIVAARPETAVDLGDLRVELHSHADQPFEGRKSVVNEQLDERAVVAVVASLHGLGGVVLGTVPDALLFLVRRPGIERPRRHARVASEEGELFQDDDVLEARLPGGHGRRHAGAARTDDDDFAVSFPRHGIDLGLCG